MKKIIVSIFLLLSLVPSTAYAVSTPTPNEIRGVWVTRWQYNSASDIKQVMDTLQANNVNTVFFQVRGEGDAFYQSSYEPWSRELIGTMGKDPGFDPLAVAVEEAHARGIKIHAWMNAMVLWKGKEAPVDMEGAPKHILNEHPEWLLKNKEGNTMPMDGNYIFADPSNLEYQQHLLYTISELAKKYNVDGIHLDYIRFPNPTWGLDSESVARFERQRSWGYQTIEDWRRGNLSRFVEKVKTVLTKNGKAQQLSTAVIGYYDDIWGWGYDNSGSFDKYLQDSKTWVLRESVDFITPMIYWTIGGKPEFETLVRDFTTTLPKEKVVVGMSTTSFSAEETMKQVDVTRKYGAAGFALFSFESNNSFWSTFAKEIASWSK